MVLNAAPIFSLPHRHILLCDGFTFSVDFSGTLCGCCGSDCGGSGCGGFVRVGVEMPPRDSNGVAGSLLGDRRKLSKDTF